MSLFPGKLIGPSEGEIFCPSRPYPQPTEVPSTRATTTMDALVEQSARVVRLSRELAQIATERVDILVGSDLSQPEAKDMPARQPGLYWDILNALLEIEANMQTVLNAVGRL